MAFLKLIHIDDLLDDVKFPLLTNQRSRKCDMTEGHLDIMTTYALRVAAVKNKTWSLVSSSS